MVFGYRSGEKAGAGWSMKGLSKAILEKDVGNAWGNDPKVV
jgi:hypothetical protein